MLRDMDMSGDNTQSLEARMEERLRELEIKWSDVLRRTGLSRQGLLDIRSGEVAPRPNTRRKIERALELAPGGFEQMQRGERPTPVSRHQPGVGQHVVDPVVLDDLNEILTVPRETLIKISRLVEQVSGPVAAEKFLLDALELRRKRADQGRDIKPPGSGDRDVS